MISVLTNVLSGVVGPAIEKFFAFKEAETEKTVKIKEIEALQQNIEAELRVRLAEEMNKPESELKKFMLDYEGKASEMPRFVQIIRGSVRPVVTYWSLGLITWMMLSAGTGATIGTNLKDIPSELWYIFLAVFGFWFGGRAMEHAVNAHQKGKLLQKQAEVVGQSESSKEVTKQVQLKHEIEKQRTERTLIESGVSPVKSKVVSKQKPVAESWDPWEELEWD